MTSGVDQPLDRRKAGSSRRVGELLRDGSTPLRICRAVLSMLLPFFATMQLGGAKTALVLLAATCTGLGALDQKPGKHTYWDDLKRTLRTRKSTCAVLLFAMLPDTVISGYTGGVLLGNCALLASIFMFPPPLPTAGFSLITGQQRQEQYGMHRSARMSLPKPSSPLISTPEDTLLTIISGLFLVLVTIIYSIFSSLSLHSTPHAIVFSALSVASAVALVKVSLPAALRSQKKVGMVLGCLSLATFGVWEYSNTNLAWAYFPASCFLFVVAQYFDTGAAVVHASHSHGHSHADHNHSHDHHDHHLHGNHSRLSAFLISRATPGSIIHSILIEKDSRRIAYFGV